MLLRGEHPQQSQFVVYGKNKFSEVVNVRAVSGPNRCFGEVKVKDRRRSRIVFSDDWFEDWFPDKHGSWQ